MIYISSITAYVPRIHRYSITIYALSWAFATLRNRSREQREIPTPLSEGISVKLFYELETSQNWECNRFSDFPFSDPVMQKKNSHRHPPYEKLYVMPPRVYVWVYI